jgi:hypothetical protein
LIWQIFTEITHRAVRVDRAFRFGQLHRHRLVVSRSIRRAFCETRSEKTLEALSCETVRRCRWFLGLWLWSSCDRCFQAPCIVRFARRSLALVQLLRNFASANNRHTLTSVHWFVSDQFPSFALQASFVIRNNLPEHVGESIVSAVRPLPYPEP